MLLQILTRRSVGCGVVQKRMWGSSTVTGDFNEELQRNHIPITGIQRAILGFGSSVASILDPSR